MFKYQWQNKFSSHTCSQIVFSTLSASSFSQLILLTLTWCTDIPTSVTREGGGGGGGGGGAVRYKKQEVHAVSQDNAECKTKSHILDILVIQLQPFRYLFHPCEK